MGYIYKITNQVNGKVYIGKTQYTIESRWKTHMYALNNGIKYTLYKTMRKYGVENFTIEQIEEASNDILDEREKYWIKEYMSFAKLGLGYNETWGGEGNQIYDYDIIYNLWNQGYGITEIVNQVGADRSVVRKILKTLDTYSVEEARRRGYQYQNYGNGKGSNKIILQFDKENNFIAEYRSAREAERQTGVTYKSISYCATGHSKTAGGYIWKFKE